VRRGTTTENLNILRDRLASIEVSVAAEVGKMNLTMRDVLALTQGDVIRLSNVRIGDPMVLKVGNKPKFLCRPGVVGNKLAVQIIEKLEDTMKDEFEELAAEGEE
jgi:flagellar motor switch protein FliM